MEYNLEIDVITTNYIRTTKLPQITLRGRIIYLVATSKSHHASDVEITSPAAAVWGTTDAAAFASQSSFTAATFWKPSARP